MADVAARAAALTGAFAHLTGRPPAGVWVAPGRVNLIGEHTDYNDGFVLPAAIDREVLAAVGPRDDGVVRCRSLDLPGHAAIALADLSPTAGAGWPAYVLGVVWALREAGLPLRGLDIVVASDVPVGAGLSSSAALESAVALAVAELVGADTSRMSLAVAARRAETDVVGAPVGIMDQVASLFGEAGSALLLDCRSLDLRAVPLSLEETGLRLVVVDTKVSHAHAGGEYGARRDACERAATTLGLPALRDATLDDLDGRLAGELLRCARHVVTENARVVATADALAAHDTLRLGQLFAASHASMRDDFRISCPELDLAVEALLDAGALAARMTGGGFGGCAVALVPAAAVTGVDEGVSAAFAAAGFADPDVFAVVPSDGAHRVA